MEEEDDSSFEELYELKTGIEDLEDYRPGGFHPTSIGDVFQNRYKVLHKLGYGGYSTIWFARDEAMRQNVALKILTARESKQSQEAAILTYLQGCHPGRAREHIPQLFDQFIIDGPNGRHGCLAMEVAGCSIAHLREDDTDLAFSSEAIRSIIAQLAMSVQYLHSCGVCHGDLHLGNFLLRTPRLCNMSVDEAYQLYGEPSSTLIKRLDGGVVEPHAPPRAAYPALVDVVCDEIVDPELLIADYGTAFKVARGTRIKVRTPAMSLPPEDLFDEPITQAADIWTLGVSLFELLTKQPLFQGDGDDLFGEMIEALGRPPSRWVDRPPNPGPIRIYNPQPGWGDLRRRMRESYRQALLATCDRRTEEELQDLERLVEGMLVFEPRERLAAIEIMKSDYVVKWALPAWRRQIQRKETAIGAGNSLGTEFPARVSGPSALDRS